MIYNGDDIYNPSRNVWNSEFSWSYLGTRLVALVAGTRYEAETRNTIIRYDTALGGLSDWLSAWMIMLSRVEWRSGESICGCIAYLYARQECCFVGVNHIIYLIRAFRELSFLCSTIACFCALDLDLTQDGPKGYRKRTSAGSKSLGHGWRTVHAELHHWRCLRPRQRSRYGAATDE